MIRIDEQKEVSRDLLQLVCFKLGDDEFAVDTLNVRYINRSLQIKKIPNAPVFVEGIIHINGEVITVIDLRKKLGLPNVKHADSTRIIVLDVNNRTIGFVVDCLKEVLIIPESITLPRSEFASGTSWEYIKSVAKLEDRFLILIDIENILSKAYEFELFSNN
jgi:purine-binding chemotaxis protein CheW